MKFHVPAFRQFSQHKPNSATFFRIIAAIALALPIITLQTGCVAEAEAGAPTPPPRPYHAPIALVKTTKTTKTTPRPLPPQKQTTIDLGATFAKWGFKPIPQPSPETAAWQNLALNHKVEVRKDKSFLILNGTRVWLGNPVANIGHRWQITRADFDNALLPVFAPVATLRNSGIPIRRPVHVFLDPGHGGTDIGCENPRFGLREKVLTLDIANRVKYLLERRGFRVTLSRSRDIDLSLDSRPAAAQRAKADLFVSIHFNSSGNNGPQITGIETFALPPRGQFSTHSNRGPADQLTLSAAYPGHPYTAWNTLLAYKIQTSLASAANATGVANRGVKRARLAVLRPATMPAVLVECGFVTSTTEGPKIATAAHREKLARGITEGIIAYQNTVATAAAAPAPAKKR